MWFDSCYCVSDTGSVDLSGSSSIFSQLNCQVLTMSARCGPKWRNSTEHNIHLCKVCRNQSVCVCVCCPCLSFTRALTALICIHVVFLTLPESSLFVWWSGTFRHVGSWWRACVPCCVQPCQGVALSCQPVASSTSPIRFPRGENTPRDASLGMLIRSGFTRCVQKEIVRVWLHEIYCCFYCCLLW